MCIFRSNNNINIARGVVNEPISLSVRATNPLGVALVLQNLSLSWSFLPSTAETEDKEQWLDTTGTESILFNANQTILLLNHNDYLLLFKKYIF